MVMNTRLSSHHFLPDIFHQQSATKKVRPVSLAEPAERLDAESSFDGVSILTQHPTGVISDPPPAKPAAPSVAAVPAPVAKPHPTAAIHDPTPTVSPTPPRSNPAPPAATRLAYGSKRQVDWRGESGRDSGKPRIFHRGDATGWNRGVRHPALHLSEQCLRHSFQRRGQRAVRELRDLRSAGRPSHLPRDLQREDHW